MKAKMMNGKKLSGPMMATLAESYVTAINNGAVPNIETAWSYICKNECQKAIEEAFNQAESQLKDLTQQMPMDESDFKASYKQIRGRSLELFHKKAVGSGVQETYLMELK